jgi:hypothetical protein
MTHSETFRPSNAAVRKALSITSSMRSGRGGMAAPLRLAPHRQSAEPTGIAIAWKRGQDSRAATVAAGFSCPIIPGDSPGVRSNFHIKAPTAPPASGATQNNHS